MKINSKIKHIISNLLLTFWPNKSHEPKGLPIDFEKDNILLFFSLSNNKQLKEVVNLVERSKTVFKNPSIVAFISDDFKFKEKSLDGLFSISNQDFNFFGNPKSNLKRWLVEHSFNTLINFADAECLFCNKFIVSANSNFKVGKYNTANVNQFDFTLAHKSVPMDKELDLYIHYLNKLNINK